MDCNIMKITNNKMNLYLLIGLIIIACNIGIYIILTNVGREYQESRQKLKEGLESNHILTATKNKLPPKNKLYVVYFTASWCDPCNQMKPYWRHKAIVEQLKKYRGTKNNNRGVKYKPFKIDIDLEKNNAIMKKYRVLGIPCIILMTNNGVEYARSVGYKSQSELKAFLIKGAVWKKER